MCFLSVVFCFIVSTCDSEPKWLRLPHGEEAVREMFYLPTSPSKSGSDEGVSGGMRGKAQQPYWPLAATEGLRALSTSAG